MNADRFPDEITVPSFRSRGRHSLRVLGANVQLSWSERPTSESRAGASALNEISDHCIFR
jgi:hypothetical protein